MRAMRQSAVIGALAAGLLAFGVTAGAATTVYNVNGQMAKVTSNCFNIAVSLTSTDCSYAKTRFPRYPTWEGPIGSGGFYPKGSAADITDPNQVRNGFIAGAGDGKIPLPLAGTVAIDDNGTPADGSDDTISAVWVFGAAAVNIATGNGERAVERWDSWTQVMAATPVSAASALGGGGYQYVIGARGIPTPSALCGKKVVDIGGALTRVPDPTDCFPSENVAAGTGVPCFWDPVIAGQGAANWVIPPPPSDTSTNPATVGVYPPGIVAGTPDPYNNCRQYPATFPPPSTRAALEDIADPGFATPPIVSHPRIGIERSLGFGDVGPGAPGNLSPNIGATTTGSFTNWSCTQSPGRLDCTNSGSLLGPPDEVPSCTSSAPCAVHGGPAAPPNGAPQGANPPDVPLTAGFSNLILILATDGAGAITSATAYWTREYQIKSGPEIGPDASGTYATNNSWGGGAFSFTGIIPQDHPTAVDDSATAIQGAATTISVLANDTKGAGANTLDIETLPAHGTATASNASISYSSDATFSGTDVFVYRLTDGNDQFATAMVTVTVTDKVPTAGTFTASSRNGAASPAIPVLVAPTVLGTGDASQHTVTAGAGVGGSCAIGAGGTVAYTPDPGFNGAGSCAFTIADFDGDTSVGTLNVSVSANPAPAGGGNPQYPAGSSLDPLTLGVLLAGLPLVARRRRSAG